MYNAVTRRLKSFALVISILSVFCGLFVIDATAAETPVSVSAPHAGAIKLSGIYWSAPNRDDLAFAPFQPIQSSKTAPHNLPTTLQSIIGQVFSIPATEHIHIFYTQHVATLAFESESLGALPSALFADVWIAASHCRPGVAITWIDLWGDFQDAANTTDLRHSFELVLDVPGTAHSDGGGSVFGSAVRLAPDQSLQDSNQRDEWSWSGWYVRSVNDVKLNGDTDPMACGEAFSTAGAAEHGELVVEQAWDRMVEEVESSPITIPLEGVNGAEEGRMSFGAVAIVAGRLVDADAALAWAHRLADWSHGGMEARAQLQIEPLLNATVVEVGDKLEYGYRLTNVGVAPARHAALQLPLPGALRYVADSGIPSHGAVSWDEDANFLSWHLGPTLLPGEVATLTLQVIVQ